MIQQLVIPPTHILSRAGLDLRKVEAEVLRRFGLPERLPACVKTADLILLKTEQRDIMHETEAWGMTAGIKPLSDRIEPLEHEQAYELFIKFPEKPGPSESGGRGPARSAGRITGLSRYW